MMKRFKYLQLRQRSNVTIVTNWDTARNCTQENKKRKHQANAANMDESPSHKKTKETSNEEFVL